jgi:hypothetical protein
MPAAEPEPEFNLPPAPTPPRPAPPPASVAARTLDHAEPNIGHDDIPPAAPLPEHPSPQQLSGESPPPSPGTPPRRDG